MSDIEDDKLAPALEFFELWDVIWRKKLIIFISVLICGAITVFYTLTLPNKYKSESTLQINTQGQDNLASSLGSQLGGLASVAGINLGSTNDNFSNVVLETITSRGFLIDLFKKINVKEKLYGIEKWDKITNKDIWNKDIYNPDSKKWTRKVSDDEKQEPTYLQTYDKFLKILNVKQDASTGLVNISIEFVDPNIAKFWLESIINEVNTILRAKEIEERERSIEYLNKKVVSIDNSEIKKIFYSLIEEQTKKMFLAQVQQQFALKIIDPPFVPEKKSSPKRATICILVTGLSLIFSILIVLISYYFRLLKLKNENE